MPSVTGADIDRMADGLFIDGTWTGRKASKFWVLLALSAVIATAGLIADSTATVIGAMIVAPLMTPILGTAFALVLADRRRLLRSVAFVLGGALVVILISYLFGAIEPSASYVDNGQVQARVSPRLIDLIAALATGAVGAFALVRSDVSDTLPGVAIAISLVPPLAVVGLLLAARDYNGAAGALLLFTTNVAAIVATGTLVLMLYRVRDAAVDAGLELHRLSGLSIAVVVGLVVLVAVPLAAGSLSVLRDEQVRRTAVPITREWARQAGWDVADVQVVDNAVVVTALGPPPEADPAALRKDLNDKGLAGSDLVLRLVVGGTRNCPANGTICLAPSD